MEYKLDKETINVYSSTVIIGVFYKEIAYLEGIPHDEMGYCTLSDLVSYLTEFYKKKPTLITVIYEEPLEGFIYQYGNHGDFWEKIGETVGYA